MSIPYYVIANSPWDSYRADPKYRQWFEYRVNAMHGWTPWFDSILPWYENPCGCYLDIYAMYTDQQITKDHPEWILTDSPIGENKLYIPWGPIPFTQFAGDLRYKDFLKNQIAFGKSTLDKGYNLLFLDDVNLDIRLADASGAAAVFQGLTPFSWAEAFVHAVESFRWELGPAKFVHNSIWFSSAPPELIDRQIKAADWIFCERGFGDPNLNPTTFIDFCDYIDRVHSLQRKIIQGEYFQENLSFKLACFLLMYEQGDLFSCADLFPDKWNQLMEIDFGVAESPRIQQTDNTWARKFSKVQVIVDFNAKTGSIK